MSSQETLLWKTRAWTAIQERLNQKLYKDEAEKFRLELDQKDLQEDIFLLQGDDFLSELLILSSSQNIPPS
jgi:hypothetical protein